MIVKIVEVFLWWLVISVPFAILTGKFIAFGLGTNKGRE